MTAIQCGDEWLLDYADGALAADMLPQAEGHLSACPRCRRELASLQCSGAMLRRYFDEAISPTHVLVQRKPRILFAVATGAAAIAAAMLISAYVLMNAGPTDSPGALSTQARAPVVVSASADDDVLAEVERETQIARLRAASEILAREPGMTERHIALEKYLAESYGVN